VTADEAVIAIIDALAAVGVRYMIVGSLASNVHGIPRSTRDADIVVEIDPPLLRRLAEVLPSSLRLQPQGSFETVTGTTRYVIELQGSSFICELFLCGEDPHDRERFSRREFVRVFERGAYIASAEDMIITKLRWANEGQRAKDLDDVRNIIAVRSDELDWDYVQRWTSEHGTRELLGQVRGSVPPA
jgi:hypothetical protein